MSHQSKVVSDEMQQAVSSLVFLGIVIIALNLVLIYFYILCYRLRKINLRVQRLFYSQELVKEPIEQMQSCTSLDRLGEICHTAVVQFPPASNVLKEIYETHKKFLEESEKKIEIKFFWKRLAIGLLTPPVVLFATAPLPYFLLEFGLLYAR